MDNCILSYQSVQIRCQGQTIADHVSFSLKAGEILCIVGQSGSGKSTLLKAALGLLGRDSRLTHGSILFQGQDLTQMDQRRLQKIRGNQIAMIFQDSASFLCPVRTIGSQIFESMRAHRSLTRAQARNEALTLFEKLHFQNGERIWSSYPFQLSGGMNQRVSIAAAMLMKPAVLLADEPTSALDVFVQKQVIQQLLEMKNNLNTAIVLVTHDIALAAWAADQVLVLQSGAAAEYGPARQVLQNPRSDYTRELLAAVPRIRRN